MTDQLEISGQATVESASQGVGVNANIIAMQAQAAQQAAPDGNGMAETVQAVQANSRVNNRGR